jgi:hypothetical protein
LKSAQASTNQQFGTNPTLREKWCGGKTFDATHLSQRRGNRRPRQYLWAVGRCRGTDQQLVAS